MNDPADAPRPPEAAPFDGLTHVRADPPERVPIRVRSSGATLSAWRMAISSDQGTGAIVLAEVGPTESHHRGEGIFLGWSQERLGAVYAALLPQDDETTDSGLQLG